jgi:hypothetical protein
VASLDLELLAGGELSVVAGLVRWRFRTIFSGADDSCSLANFLNISGSGPAKISWVGDWALGGLATVVAAFAAVLDGFFATVWSDVLAAAAFGAVRFLAGSLTVASAAGLFATGFLAAVLVVVDVFLAGFSGSAGEFFVGTISGVLLCRVEPPACGRTPQSLKTPGVFFLGVASLGVGSHEKLVGRASHAVGTPCPAPSIAHPTFTLQVTYFET